jgi:hypothetical protein
MAGTALEMLVRALQTGAMPPETTLVTPHSFPETGSLKAVKSNAHATGAH